MLLYNNILNKVSKAPLIKKLDFEKLKKASHFKSLSLGELK